MALFDELLRPLLDKLAELFAPISKPIKAVINIFNLLAHGITGTFDKAKQVANNFIEAYNLLHEFSINFDRDARHRVVETVRAYQQIRRMAIDIPVEIWQKLQDLVRQVEAKYSGAAFATQELEGLEGVTELRALFTKLGPKLARIFTKVVEVLGFFQIVLEDVDRTLSDLLVISADLREEIEKVNRLNFIFLPQDNKRERVKLESGETIYRRNPALGKVNR
jgi:hypothetical protein